MRINRYNNTFKEEQKKNNPHITFGTSIKGFPGIVEMGVSQNCNLRCNYCPNHLLQGKAPERIMPMRLFKKILSDLQQIDYDGKIFFHRFNEPLMFDGLEEYIKRAKEALPKTTIELFTNGLLLTRARLERLKESPVDKIIVTQHTKKGFIDSLGEIPDELLEKVDVKYSEELNLVNRVRLNKTTDKPLQETCYSIENDFVINTDGQVPLCIDDYYAQIVLGDLHSETIEEIWNSPFSQKIRNELAKGNRSHACIKEVCGRCERTVDQRTLKPDFSENSALYRKHLLLAKGCARISKES